MFSSEFLHEAGAYINGPTDTLLKTQASEFSSTCNERTGRLSRALNDSSTASVGGDGVSVELRYPIHIRFLDLKRGADGRKKKRYAPIYNKYVYGYIKSGVWRWLNAHLPGVIARTFEDTFKDTDNV